MFVPYYVENWVIILELNNLSLFSIPVTLIRKIIDMCQRNYTSTVEVMYILNPSYFLMNAWNFVKSTFSY